jgi:hypothetical protein
LDEGDEVRKMNERFRIHTTLVTVAFLVIGFLFLFLFQNCNNLASNGFAPKDSKVSSYTDRHDASFFAYPYMATPELYADLQVVRLPDTGSIHNLKIVAAAALASGAHASIQYSVEVKDAAGIALCPQNSGTLQPSYSTISFNCVTVQESAGARVRISLNFGSGSLSVERQL